MNKRDEARTLSQEAERARQSARQQDQIYNNKSEKLREIAETLKPDPECSHGVSFTIDNTQICGFCYSSKIDWLD